MLFKNTEVILQRIHHVAEFCFDAGENGLYSYHKRCIIAYGFILFRLKRMELFIGKMMADAISLCFVRMCR